MQQRQKIRNARDIVALPGYIERVDPAVTPLSHIVDSYYIGPGTIRCALCGQGHSEGRIVALITGGITNIGHICGKRFGEQKYTAALSRYLESLNLVLR